VCRLPFISDCTSPARAFATAFGGHGADLRFGAHQHRHDQAAPRRFQRAEQRVAVARVDHGAQHRRHALAALEQAREDIGVAQHDLGRGHVGEGDVLRRRDDGDGAGDQVDVAVGDMAVEDDLVAVGPLFLDGQRACDQVAHRHRAAEAQVLPALQQRRHQRLGSHGLGRHAVLARALCIGVEGVDVARDEGQRLDIGPSQPVRTLDRLADLDLIEGAVAEGVHVRSAAWVR
jgi:hypothetical protein